MITSILFIIASISTIIFATIYVKKKNRLYSLKSQEKVKGKKRKKNIKTIWGIDDIKDSILTINGKHSVIIELGSIEYRLLNDEEQNNVDNSLTNISKTFSYETQFFSTIKKIDTTDKIEDIRKRLDKQKNEKISEYGQNIIEYLQNIMQEDNLYVRKNYLIITSNEDYQKAQIDLKEFYNGLKYNLSNIRITSKMLSNQEIIELIYRELNKNCYEKIEDIIQEGGLDFYVQNTKGKENIFRKKQ